MGRGRGVERALRPRIRAQPGESPRRADPSAVRGQSAAAEPVHGLRQRAAELRLPERRLHAPDPAHGRPADRVADPAQLPGPLPPAVLRDHRSDDVQLEPGDPLHQRGRAPRLPESFHDRVPVLRHAPERCAAAEPGRCPGRRAHQEPVRQRVQLRLVRGGCVQRDARGVAGGRWAPPVRGPRGARPPLQRSVHGRRRERLGQRELLRRHAQGGRHLAGDAVDPGLRQRQPRVPAAALARADRARPDSRHAPGPSAHHRLAVRDRHAR